MLENNVQFVKVKKELFFLYFSPEISEYSCSHMANVAAHAHSELQ